MTEIDGPLNNAYFLYVYIRSPKKSSKESFYRQNLENEVSTFSGFVLVRKISALSDNNGSHYGKCVLVTKNIFCPTKVFCSKGLQGRTYIADDNVMVLQNLKREDRSLSGYYGSFIFIFIRPQKMDHMWPSLPGSRHLNLHFPHELLLLQVHWHQDTQKS